MLFKVNYPKYNIFLAREMNYSTEKLNDKVGKHVFAQPESCSSRTNVEQEIKQISLV